MREIKFKAKRLDGKGWIEGTPICINGKPYGIMIGEKESPDIDPNTVCQFTGLKDCDGTDIFEGDLLAEKRFPMYEVGYVDSEFAASYIGENTFIFKLPALSKDCVACGSIYDRKEGEK
jgi:hypothetical protein